jgi:hypothetical protein
MYRKTGTAGEILINGNHCLFAIVCKAGAQQEYLTHVLRETETSQSVRSLYIVTTFKSLAWRKIIEQHFKPAQGQWQLDGVCSNPFTIDSDILEATITESEGNGWAISASGSTQVSCTN